MTYEILSFGLFGSFSRDIVLAVHHYQTFYFRYIGIPGVVHSLGPTLNVQSLEYAHAVSEQNVYYLIYHPV